MALHRALFCDIIYLARKLSTATAYQRIASTLSMKLPRRSPHVQLCTKEFSRVVGFYVGSFASLRFIPPCLLIFLNIMF